MEADQLKWSYRGMRAVLLARFGRLTLRNFLRNNLTMEMSIMVAAVRELPITGYALAVDGRMKTEFKTRDDARIGAQELKRRFPMLRINIYDAETRTKEEIEVAQS